MLGGENVQNITNWAWCHVIALVENCHPSYAQSTIEIHAKKLQKNTFLCGIYIHIMWSISLWPLASQMRVWMYTHIAKTLMRACDALSSKWGHTFRWGCKEMWEKYSALWSGSKWLLSIVCLFVCFCVIKHDTESQCSEQWCVCVCMCQLVQGAQLVRQEECNCRVIAAVPDG